MGPSYSPDEHLLKSCLVGDYAMVRFLVEEIGANPAFQKRISEERKEELGVDTKQVYILAFLDLDFIFLLLLLLTIYYHHNSHNPTQQITVISPVQAAEAQGRTKISQYLFVQIMKEKGDKGGAMERRQHRRTSTADQLFDFTCSAAWGRVGGVGGSGAGEGGRRLVGQGGRGGRGGELGARRRERTQSYSPNTLSEVHIFLFISYVEIILTFFFSKKKKKKKKIVHKNFNPHRTPIPPRPHPHP